MASPGQTWGLCGHLMAGFDKLSVCARCRDKKKGSDPCVKDKVCPHCDILTEEQKLRLATSVYQKEKRELKTQTEELSGTQVPCLCYRVAKDIGVKSSEEVSTTPAGAKTKKMDKSLEAVSSTPEGAKAKKTQKTPDITVAKEKSKKWHSSPARSSKRTTDSKLEAMDLTWSEQFSRLEAMPLSKSFSQPEPLFQPVKITPVKPPPAGAVDNTEPFFAPTRSTDQPTSSQQQASDRPQPVD